MQQEAAPAAEPETVPQEALLLPPGFAGSDVAGDAIAVNGSAARVDTGLLNERARGDFQLPPGLEGIAAFGGFWDNPGATAAGPREGRSDREGLRTRRQAARVARVDPEDREAPADVTAGLRVVAPAVRSAGAVFSRTA